MREALSGFNGSLPLEAGAQADTHLYDERVAVVRIVPLQPQHARVDVRHQTPAAEDVRAQSALRTLGQAAVLADRREAGEQDAQLDIETSPGGMQRRFIAWGKQDRIR